MNNELIFCTFNLNILHSSLFFLFLSKNIWLNVQLCGHCWDHGDKMRPKKSMCNDYDWSTCGICYSMWQFSSINKWSQVINKVKRYISQRFKAFSRVLLLFVQFETELFMHNGKFFLLLFSCTFQFIPFLTNYPILSYLNDVQSCFFHFRYNSFYVFIYPKLIMTA